MQKDQDNYKINYKAYLALSTNEPQLAIASFSTGN
jgi:hypothetical protein